MALINSGPDQGKLISRKQFPFLLVRHVDLKKCFGVEKDEIWFFSEQVCFNMLQFGFSNNQLIPKYFMHPQKMEKVQHFIL